MPPNTRGSWFAAWTEQLSRQPCPAVHEWRCTRTRGASRKRHRSAKGLAAQWHALYPWRRARRVSCAPGPARCVAAAAECCDWWLTLSSSRCPCWLCHMYMYELSVSCMELPHQATALTQLPRLREPQPQYRHLGVMVRSSIPCTRKTGTSTQSWHWALPRAPSQLSLTPAVQSHTFPALTAHTVASTWCAGWLQLVARTGDDQ